LWGAKTGVGNIAYLTHLGGIAAGLLYYVLSPRIESWWASSRSSNDDSGIKVLQFRKKTPDKPDETYFESKVDPILKKISQHGINSLTAEERRILEDASRKK